MSMTQDEVMDLAGESLEDWWTAEAVRREEERNNRFISEAPLANMVQLHGGNDQGIKQTLAKKKGINNLNERFQEDLDMEDDGVSDGARAYNEMMAEFSGDDADDEEVMEGKSNNDNDGDLEMSSPHWSAKHNPGADDAYGDGAFSPTASEFDFAPSPTPGTYFSQNSKSQLVHYARDGPAQKSVRGIFYKHGLEAGKKSVQLGTPPPFSFTSPEVELVKGTKRKVEDPNEDDMEEDVEMGEGDEMGESGENKEERKIKKLKVRSSNALNT